MPNGVIITPIQDPTTGQKVGSAILSAFLIPTTMANRKTQATAIYVFPAPPSAEQIADELEAATRVEAGISGVTVGMTRDVLIHALGSPVSSDTSIDPKGNSTETAIFVGSRGARYVIVLNNSVVARVTRR